MTHRFALSRKTRALITQLKKQWTKFSTTFKSEDADYFELSEFNSKINLKRNLNRKKKEDLEFLIASMNAALLKDLAKSLPGYLKKQKIEEEKSWFARFKNSLYPLLIIAGTFAFACDGFAGITSIVSILPLSAPVLFLVGIVFALISVLAFNAFNLTEIAKNLEINKKEARQLVDYYLKEVKRINEIRKLINKDYIKRKNQEELDNDLQIIELLIARYNALAKGREALTKRSENSKLIVSKYLVASLIGIIFFSAGFFAGEALATAVATLFIASTAPIFWPIFVASFAVGLAALGVYWFVERPSIDKLVGRWFGLDTDKIEQLCDAKTIEEHSSKLETLKINLLLQKEKLTADSKKIIEIKAKLASVQMKINDRKFQGANFKEESTLCFFSPALQSAFASKKTLNIRNKTKILLENLKSRNSQTEKIIKLYKSNNPEQIKLKKLIEWFGQQIKPDDDTEQLEIASLNSALLKELAIAVCEPLAQKKEKKSASHSKNFLYFFLTIAGSIFFGCDGFYGVTSIISMITIPKLAIFIVGAVFGLMSVISFLAFDLTEIGKNLGIRKKNVHKLVDVYLKEMKALKSIRRGLDNLFPQRKTIDELENDLLIIDLIIARHSNLDIERKFLIQLKSETTLTVLKYVIPGLIGIIYFSTAFFTGQTVALAIAGLFVAGTAPLAWPIVLVSVAIGLAALAVYWYVERPSIEKLVVSLFGWDPDQIEELCNPDKVEKEKSKLEDLKINITICKEEMLTRLFESNEWEKTLQAAENELEVLEKNDQRFVKDEKQESKLPAHSSIADQQDSFFNSKIFQSASSNDKQWTANFLNI
ncbi:MAG: hypothetical protein H0U57_00960 [Tatlockia sp.]|nr:hypothetical protein [Tatlockia sp.]